MVTRAFMCILRMLRGRFGRPTEPTAAFDRTKSTNHGKSSHITICPRRLRIHAVCMLMPAHLAYADNVPRKSGLLLMFPPFGYNVSVNFNRFAIALCKQGAQI